MKTLYLSITIIGFLVTMAFSFGISSAQAQSSDLPCANITELAKSVTPPNSPGLTLFKNYTLRCATMSGSAVQMDYVPNVTSVVTSKTSLNSQSMIQMIPDSGNDISV